MTDVNVTFNWNGETIDFSAWADDAFGAFEYTTCNRQHRFNFELVPVDNIVRIYITDGPSYGNRPADGHSTHRHFDHNLGLHYICIRHDLQPETVPEALTWAVGWAEGTSEYIRTGRAFS